VRSEVPLESSTGQPSSATDVDSKSEYVCLPCFGRLSAGPSHESREHYCYPERCVRRRWSGGRDRLWRTGYRTRRRVRV